MRRRYRSVDFSAGPLADAKSGRTVTVCVPARNEAATIGSLLARIRRHLMRAVPLVDELIVVDDASEDSTAAEAAAEGATVVDVRSFWGDRPYPGKGQAMWKGLAASSGDLIVYCDADIEAFDPGFVVGLLGPLLSRDDVTFVKGCYERPLAGRPGEGGRVTELVARPLISLFFPHLADLRQPLSGECAAPRRVLEELPFAGGYGVDLGLLVDVTERFGNAGLVECDLGVRVHRNRPLSELSPQALAVMQLALQRAGMGGTDLPRLGHLRRPDAEAVAVELLELPPLASLPPSRKSA